jgi:predicted DNA-binding transcriptional regulator AlpA
MTAPAPLTSRRLLRLRDIIGCPRRGVEPIIPVSVSTFYNWMRAGIIPQPIRLGKTSLWRSDDIADCIDRMESGPVALLSQASATNENSKKS